MRIVRLFIMKVYLIYCLKKARVVLSVMIKNLSLVKNPGGLNNAD